MAGTSKIVPNESKYSLKQQSHTYTPQSHEELLRIFSKNTVKGEDIKDLKRENEILNKQLNNSKKQLKKLKKRIAILENNKNTDISSFLKTLPESQSNIQYEIKLNTGDEYAKSWEVLGHHFSEVIRRHHELLAEKDRLIRELQEQQYNRDILTKPLYPSDTKGHASQTNENDIRGQPNNITSHYNWTVIGQTRLQNFTSEAGPFRDFQCEDQCKCDETPVNGEDCCEDQCNCNAMLKALGEDSFNNSGEILREHFSELIRRHKQELLEKDQQIRDLQEALKGFGQKSPKKQLDYSEVQMWYHDYHVHSQPSVRADLANTSQERDSDDWALTTSQPPDATTSDEEEESFQSSTDTFVAIDKCQRLESIENLERLRQNLIKRLELEEKLDKLYWQKELNRYREFREEAGDNFDPDCSFNTDFESLENTRLELLRALKDMKDSAQRLPEIYVKPHLLEQDSESTVQIQVPENEKKRRVSFTEQVTITSIQTTSTYDE